MKVLSETWFRLQSHASPGLARPVGFYVSEHPDGHYASKTTFTKCYRDRWKLVLQFRNHDKVRCSLCAKFSEQRRLCQNDAARKVTDEQQADHVRTVFADRAAYSRVQRMCASSCMPNPAGMEAQSAESTVLCITIDGMDQAFDSFFFVLKHFQQ